MVSMELSQNLVPPLRKINNKTLVLKGNRDIPSFFIPKNATVLGSRGCWMSVSGLYEPCPLFWICVERARQLCGSGGPSFQQEGSSLQKLPGPGRTKVSLRVWLPGLPETQRFHLHQQLLVGTSRGHGLHCLSLCLCSFTWGLIFTLSPSESDQSAAGSFPPPPSAREPVSPAIHPAAGHTASMHPTHSISYPFISHFTTLQILQL